MEGGILVPVEGSVVGAGTPVDHVHRARTYLTPEQTSELQIMMYFNYSRYGTNKIKTELRRDLAQRTGLTMRQIGHWNIRQLKPNKRKPCAVKARRYSKFQLSVLKYVFKRTHYPDATWVDIIATATGLPSQRVMEWFSNQRYKWRCSRNHVNKTTACAKIPITQ